MTAPATIEVGIYQKLKTTDVIFALVRERIYPVVAPQNAARPYVVYERINAIRISALTSDTDMAHGTWRISAYAETRDEAVNLGNEVRKALQRYKGTISDQTFEDVFVVNQLDVYDDLDHLHHVGYDFDIWYRET